MGSEVQPDHVRPGGCWEGFDFCSEWDGRYKIVLSRRGTWYDFFLYFLIGFISLIFLFI